MTGRRSAWAAWSRVVSAASKRNMLVQCSGRCGWSPIPWPNKTQGTPPAPDLPSPHEFPKDDQSFGWDRGDPNCWEMLEILADCRHPMQTTDGLDLVSFFLPDGTLHADFAGVQRHLQWPVSPI